MAEDTILRETKQSIDRLFAQVSGGAGSASTGLYDVAQASKTASSGLGSLASGTGEATRAAGVFVTSVRQIETATSKYSTSLTASLSALNEEVGATINSATSRIDENMATVGAGMGLAARGAAGLAANIKNIGPGLKSFYTGLKSGSLKIGTMMSKVADGGKMLLGGWGKYLALGAAALGTVEDYVDDSYKSWKLLTTAGIGLAGNLNNVGGMAGRTRLDFKDLSASLSRASPALAAFGGMADFGAETLVHMQEAMMDTVEGHSNSTESYNKTMKMLGIGPQESMSLLTSMVEDQTFAAKLRGMQDASDGTRRAELTSEYITQLDQLSKLTGKSREQLAKEMAQKAQDAQFAATLLGMDEEQALAAKSQLKFIEETYGKDASELFKARLAGVVPTGDGARKIFATSLGGTLSDMANATRNASADTAGDILSSFHDELGASALETRDMLIPLAKAGGLVSSSFGNLFSATHKATLKNQALIEQLDKNTTGMHNLGDAIDRLYNQTIGKKADGTRDPKGMTGLLEGRTALETVADLAGTAVHAWMTAIGFGGSKFKVPGAGVALEGMEIGYDIAAGMAEIGMWTSIEGPAAGDGTFGEGRGRHNYDYGKIIGKLFGVGGSDASTDTGLDAGLSGKLGHMILQSPVAEASVIAELEKKGISSGRVTAGIARAKMAAAQQRTGKTQQELIAAQGATGPGGRYAAHGLREVVGTMENTRIDSVLSAAEKSRAQAIAEYTYAPIVKAIKEQLVAQNDTNKKVVETDKNGNKTDSNITKESNGASGSRIQLSNSMYKQPSSPRNAYG